MKRLKYEAKKKVNAFELFKHDTNSYWNDRLHDLPLIQFARVIKVIDIQTVNVETVIQTSLTRNVYTISLLNLSSALLEINSFPKIGDTVLILFLQKYDPRMFISNKIIENPHATGYNQFSGVGVLMSTVKNMSQTIIDFYEDDGKPVMDIESRAEIYAKFNNLATINFCRTIMDSEDEQVISICFGQGRPYVQKFLSKVTREHGFWKNGENELIELDAAVSEKYSKYAPINKDIQGKQVTSIGLGLDKNDEPEETEAPIAEVIHGKSPVSRDIRSKQTIKIGIGNDEKKSKTEQRDAEVNIELGEKADIVVNSKSAIKIINKKSITLKTDSTELIEIGNQIATLGKMIDELLDALEQHFSQGSPYVHRSKAWASVFITPLRAKWNQVFKK